MANKIDDIEQMNHVLEAPHVPRKVRLWWHQWIGIPVLFALPILSLLGVFGESSAKSSAKSALLELEVEYPDRLRYWQIRPLEVSVRNSSQQPLDHVEVKFDPTYINSFADVTFTPGVEKAYTVTMRNLAPGESRLVSVELRADHYGTHEGAIEAFSDSVRLAGVNVSTFTFP
jgi:hypothetical protein